MNKKKEILNKENQQIFVKDVIKHVLSNKFKEKHSGYMTIFGGNNDYLGTFCHYITGLSRPFLLFILKWISLINGKINVLGKTQCQCQPCSCGTLNFDKDVFIERMTLIKSLNFSSQPSTFDSYVRKLIAIGAVEVIYKGNKKLLTFKRDCFIFSIIESCLYFYFQKEKENFLKYQMELEMNDKQKTKEI